MALIPARRNELLEVVEREGLPRLDLKSDSAVRAGEERGLHYQYDSCTIAHLPTRSRLTLDDLSERPPDLHRPPEDRVRYRLIALVPDSERVRWRTERPSWAAAIQDVADWARTVREVHETPDLWKHLDWARDLIRLQAGEASNELFSRSEQELISLRLRQLTESVAAAGNVTDRQLREIKETLAEVAEASTRVGRKDWLLMAGGALLSLALSAALPPDVLQHIVVALTHGIAHVLEEGRGLPRIDAH